MGLYIDPQDQTKEQWLKENALSEIHPPGFDAFDAMIVHGAVVVCLVDNGHFTAAAVGFNQREVNAFRTPDGREKKWYAVSVESIDELTGGQASKYIALSKEGERL